MNCDYPELAITHEYSQTNLPKDSEDTTRHLMHFLKDFLSNTKNSSNISLDLIKTYGVRETIEMAIHELENSANADSSDKKFLSELEDIGDSYFNRSSINSGGNAEIEADSENEYHRRFLHLIFAKCLLCLSYRSGKYSPLNAMNFFHIIYRSIAGDAPEGTVFKYPVMITTVSKSFTAGRVRVNFLDHEAYIPTKDCGSNSHEFVLGGGYPYPSIGFSEYLSKRHSLDKVLGSRTWLKDQKILVNPTKPHALAFPEMMSGTNTNILYIPSNYLNLSAMGSKKYSITFNGKFMKRINEIVKNALPTNLPTSSTFVDWPRNLSERKQLEMNTSRGILSASNYIERAGKSSAFSSSSEAPPKDWARFFQNNHRFPDMKDVSLEESEITDNLIHSIESLYDILSHLRPELNKHIQKFEMVYREVSRDVDNPSIYSLMSQSLGRYDESADYFHSAIISLSQITGDQERIADTIFAFTSAFGKDPEHYMIPKTKKVKMKYVTPIFKYLVLRNVANRNESSSFGIVSRSKSTGIVLGMSFIQGDFQHHAISNNIGGFELYRERDGFLEVLSSRYGVMKSFVDYDSLVQPGDSNQITQGSYLTQNLISILNNLDPENLPNLGKFLISINSKKNPFIALALIASFLKREKTSSGRYESLVNDIISVYKNTFPKRFLENWKNVKQKDQVWLGVGNGAVRIARYALGDNVLDPEYVIQAANANNFNDNKHNLADGVDVLRMDSIRLTITNIVKNPETSKFALYSVINDVFLYSSNDANNQTNNFPSLMALLGQVKNIASDTSPMKAFMRLYNVLRLWSSADENLLSSLSKGKTTDGTPVINSTQQIIEDLDRFRKISLGSNFVRLFEYGLVKFSDSTLIDQVKDIKDSLRKNLMDSNIAKNDRFWPKEFKPIKLPGGFNQLNQDFGWYAGNTWNSSENARKRSEFVVKFAAGVAEVDARSYLNVANRAVINDDKAIVLYYGNGKTYLADGKRVAYLSKYRLDGDADDAANRTFINPKWVYVNAVNLPVVKADSETAGNDDSIREIQEKYIDLVIGDAKYSEVYKQLTGLWMPNYVGHHMMIGNRSRSLIDELATGIVNISAITETTEVTEIKGSPEERSYPDLIDRSYIHRDIIPVHFSGAGIFASKNYKDAKLNRIWHFHDKPVIYKFDSTKPVNEQYFSNVHNVILETDISDDANNKSYIIPASFSVIKASHDEDPLKSLVQRWPELKSSSLDIKEAITDSKLPMNPHLNWRTFQ